MYIIYDSILPYFGMQIRNYINNAKGKKTVISIPTIHPIYQLEQSIKRHESPEYQC